MLKQHLLLATYVGVGGFIGANARFLLSLATARFVATGDRLPLGTLMANFTGSMLLAVFLVWASKQAMLPNGVRLMITTGFFGAFTTFSTFANEGVALALDGEMSWAVGYIVGTNVICLIGVVIGLWVGSQI